MENHHYVQNDWNHDDEVIDTLSLSDFMIYENNGDPQDFYQLHDQNLNDFDDDQFEFSSELLKTSVNTTNIVFCGKIIPYKENSVNSPITRKIESKNSSKQRWKFVRFFKKSSKSKSNINYGVPIRRVSILASATKPRWYLLMFGFGSSSFSAQMHIRDLKKRQSSMGYKDRTDDKKTLGGGSWSLVRFLGCGGGGGDNHHPITIKKMERVN